MLNRVTLIGNLGRDPEIRRLENGAVVAKFSLATNENYRDKSGEWQTQTEWHDIIVWRQLAERAEAQLKKGMQIYVEGKLTTRTWQDQEGNQRRTTEVVANAFRVLGRREDGGRDQTGSFPSAADEMPSSYSSSTPMPTAANDTGAPQAEDDLPF
jgi:single-strand DNA-binding protein